MVSPKLRIKGIPKVCSISCPYSLRRLKTYNITTQSIFIIFAGFTRAAFQDCQITVSIPTASTIKAAAINIQTVSCGRNTYCILHCSIRYNAIGNPIANAIAIHLIKRIHNNPTTCLCVAPLILRKPISFIRLSTEYQAKPNNPKAVRNKLIHEKYDHLQHPLLLLVQILIHSGHSPKF